MTKRYSMPTLFVDIDTPLRSMLDPGDEWVLLADNCPWEELSAEYEKSLKNDKVGAGNVSSRAILAAVMVKHITGLSDENTIKEIQRNPYYQYLAGREFFSYDRLFDPSLFVTIRKRLTNEVVSRMSEAIMNTGIEVEDGREVKTAGVRRPSSSTVRGRGRKKGGDDDGPAGGNDEPCLFAEGSVPEEVPSEGNAHKETAPSCDGDGGGSGKKMTDEECLRYLKDMGLDPSAEKEGSVKIDATCCPVEVRYPVDIDILNDCRKELERIVRKLYEGTGTGCPRLYSKVARKEYLLLKTKKLVNNSKRMKGGIKGQLSYIRRDLGYIDAAVASDPGALGKLGDRQRDLLEIIRKAYEQQKFMHESGTHSVQDRIVSIYQPHVRPIVRGKSSARVEFGPKVGVAICRGYAFIDHLSWDAYNESEDLCPHLLNHMKRTGGHLPKEVYADKIYMNKWNRQILRLLGIRAAGEPLGRVPLSMKTQEAQRQIAEDKAKRNEVEGQFGTTKRIYDADDVRAKRPDTGEAWTALCFLAKNLGRFMKTLSSSFFVLIRKHGLLLSRLAESMWAMVMSVVHRIAFMLSYTIVHGNEMMKSICGQQERNKMSSLIFQ